MKRYSILLVVAGAMLWGTDSLFRRPLSQALSPVTIVFLEHCVLSAVVFPVLVRGRRQIAQLSRSEWIAVSFIALGGSVAATSLFTYSIKYGNPSVTVLLQKSQPLFTIPLARWFLRERPRPVFWAWVIPAVAGGYLVSTPEWRQGLVFGSNQPLSTIAAIGAAALWGISTVFGRYIITRLTVPVLTGLRFVVALPVLAAIYVVQPAAAQHLPQDFDAILATIGMALIPGLAALLLYYKGLKRTVASLASLGELAFPATAVVANWIFLDFRLAWSQIAGAALLIISVTAATRLDTGGQSRDEAAPRSVA